MYMPHAPKKSECPRCGQNMTAVKAYSGYYSHEANLRQINGAVIHLNRVVRDEVTDGIEWSPDHGADCTTNAKVCPSCGHVELTAECPEIFLPETPEPESVKEPSSLLGRLKGEKAKERPIRYYAVDVDLGGGEKICFCARGVRTPTAKELIDDLELFPEQALAARVTVMGIDAETAARDYDLNMAAGWPIYGKDDDDPD